MTQPHPQRDGYYTTREGHAAIGYVGNVALERFPPPSPEIVQHFEKALRELPWHPQSGAT